MDARERERDDLDAYVASLSEEEQAGIEGASVVLDAAIWRARADAAEARAAALEADNRRLREALEWYADESRYRVIRETPDDLARRAILWDRGNCARAALAGERAGEGVRE